jgi:hypothetical protein
MLHRVETLYQQNLPRPIRQGKVKLLLHSVARGNLKPLVVAPDGAIRTGIAANHRRYSAHHLRHEQQYAGLDTRVY